MREEGSPNKRSKASSKSRSDRQKGEVDRISKLPNNILIPIISRLNVRDATATSILSTRWRYLHTYTTRLNFTFYPKVNPSSPVKIQERDFLNHVSMINRVLNSHNDSKIVKELKLHVYRMEGASIEKWVEFAFTREMESIDITMLKIPSLASIEKKRSRLQFDYQRIHGSYSFGLSALISSKPHLPALKCLKQLTLVYVEVTDQDFDLLMSNFLALETLCLDCPRNSTSFEKISIVGHPNLKHFDIGIPHGLNSIEIRDVMNLLSLRIFNLGQKCTLKLENIPKLVEFYTNEAGKQTRWLDELLASHIPSCIRDQLQLLHLSTYLYPRPPQPPLRRFQFVNVKRLELVLDSIKRERAPVHRLYPLLKACLSLEKLKIKFVWTRLDVELIKSWKIKAPIYCSNVKKVTPNLKVFEMKQYLGCQAELELATYVINHGVNLEQVTVVACDATERIRCKALTRAQEYFQKITPSSIHLQII